MTTAKQQALKRFGEEIQRIRRQAGLSQEELADAAHIHRTYMGRIEALVLISTDKTTL